MEEYRSEKKRGEFIMNSIKLQGKAKTSLERAKFFNQEIKKIIL